jgi:hypothetical protein
MLPKQLFSVLGDNVALFVTLLAIWDGFLAFFSWFDKLMKTQCVLCMLNKVLTFDFQSWVIM